MATLSTYARLLRDDGQLQDSCDVLSEVATMFRCNAASMHDRSESDSELRHQFLFRYSCQCLEAGRLAEALSSIKEAIDVLKRGMDSAPAPPHSLSDARKTLHEYTTHRRFLQRIKDQEYVYVNVTLGILAGCEGKGERDIQILESTRNAVRTCRAQRASDSSEQPEPLWQQLTSVALFLYGRERPKEASEVLSEVVSIIRSAMSRETAPERLLLPPALYCQSFLLFEADRVEEALGLVREAKNLKLGELAGKRLSAQSSIEIMILDRYIHHELKVISSQGQADDITGLLRQRVELLREVSESAPASTAVGVLTSVHEDLASSLEMYGLHLANLGRAERSMDVMQKAISLYRILGCHNAAEHASLCQKMRRFSSILSQHGRHKEALELATESVVLARKGTEWGMADKATQHLIDQCIKNRHSCQQRLMEERQFGS